MKRNDSQTMTAWIIERLSIIHDDREWQTAKWLLNNAAKNLPLSRQKWGFVIGWIFYLAGRDWPRRNLRQICSVGLPDSFHPVWNKMSSAVRSLVWVSKVVTSKVGFLVTIATSSYLGLHSGSIVRFSTARRCTHWRVKHICDKRIKDHV